MTVSRKTLWVPGPLPGLNEIINTRGSGRGRSNPWAEKKKKYASDIGLLARHQQLGIIGPCSWTFLLVELHRQRDPSNIASGAQKIIEDALQDSGILENDGWKHILDFKHWWAVYPAKPGVLVIFDTKIVPFEEASSVFAAKHQIRP